MFRRLSMNLCFLLCFLGIGCATTANKQLQPKELEQINSILYVPYIRNYTCSQPIKTEGVQAICQNTFLRDSEDDSLDSYFLDDKLLTEYTDFGGVKSIYYDVPYSSAM